MTVTTEQFIAVAILLVLLQIIGMVALYAKGWCNATLHCAKKECEQIAAALRWHHGDKWRDSLDQANRVAWKKREKELLDRISELEEVMK